MKYITTIPSTTTYMLGYPNFKLITQPPLPPNFVFEGIEKKIKYSDYKNNYYWIDVIYLNEPQYMYMKDFVLKQQVSPYNPRQASY